MKEVTAVNTLWRSAVFRAMIGAVLGMLVGLLLCQRSELPLLSFVLPNSAYGALVMGATVVYDSEDWSLTRSTLCHLLVTLAGFCILGAAQGWLRFVPLWVLIAFLGVYFIIWLVQWAICSYRVHSLNLFLRRRRSRRE